MEQLLLGKEHAAMAQRLVATQAFDAPIESKHRPQSASDFAQYSVGLFVRRVGVDMFDVEKPGNWGQYAGAQKMPGSEKVTVILRQCGHGGISPYAAPIVGLALYDSTEELAEHWKLD